MKVIWSFFICSIITIHAFAGNPAKIVVTGSVLDEQTKEPLIGAIATTVDKKAGAAADTEGNFNIEVDGGSNTVLLHISYTGYESRDIEVAPGTKPTILLKARQIMATEVVVSASRTSERIMQSPVTIEKMDANSIKQTPSYNFYQSLGEMKSVDMVSSSLTFNIVNVRGFGNTEKPGLLQLVDGMDNQIPGLNYPIGYGITDLDVDNVELIPGAASALYGANAFNGVMNVRSKSPFTYQGLSIQEKTGVNHVDGIDHAPAGLYDMQLRYAKAFRDKFAFKINAAYFKGQDWVASDKRDVNLFTGPNNSAYDGLNVYGDEIAGNINDDGSGAPIDPSSGPINVSRTGYNEKDLLDYNTHILKLDGALHYRLTDKLEASYVYKYWTGTTVVHSSNRYSMNDIVLKQQKIQLESPYFFIRAYTNSDDAGNTYDSRFLAFNINNAWKNDTQWFTDYANAYFGGIPNITPGDHTAARTYADIGRPLPGTEVFNHLKDSITAINILKGGAGFDDLTKLYNAETQYNFAKEIKFVELIAGASYRYFNLHSNGTLYGDTAGNPLHFYEYGSYVQAGKKLFNDKLKLTASVRYDKSENYDGQFSPRFAAVYQVGKENFFRASYQTAFRMPTSQDQYLNLNVGFLRALGGLPSTVRAYDLPNKIFTAESVTDYANSLTEYINQNGVDSFAAGVEKYKSKLVAPDYSYVKPEHVKSYEIGYRGLLSENDLYFDISTYYMINHDFIGLYNVVRPEAGGSQNADSITTAAYSIAINDPKPKVYQVTTNLKGDVYTYGVALGLTYNMPKNYVARGNVTYSKLEKAPYGRTLFNTPTYKTNLGLSNDKVYKNLGFSVNWRWTDSYLWQSLFGDGMLAAANNIDAQLTYTFPKVSTSMRIGATNALNNRHTEVYGGPTIGAIYYLALTYGIK